MKFKNVTNTFKGQRIVKVLSSNDGGKNIKVYTYKDIVAIFSQVNDGNHTSLSKGNGELTLGEIDLAVKNIMKTSIDKVKIMQTSSGVVHIHMDSGI